MLDFCVGLDVPPDTSFDGLVASVVRDAASRAGMESSRASALGDVAAIGFSAIVTEELAESRAPMHVRASAQAHALTVSLLERGLPIDDAAMSRDPRWTQLLDCVDEASWHCHGIGGSELRLVVAYSPPQGTAPADALDPHDTHETPPAAPATAAYTFRAFEPQDAAALARIFYRTYGYHYTPTLFYTPERIVAANASGLIHSFVAQAEDGTIAAHYAIRPDNAAVGEGCAAVVLPEHRGRDVITQLRAAAESAARELGFQAYYTEPVTTHPFTQKASEHFGAIICAIKLGASPAALRPSHMNVAITDQRQSLTYYAKLLRPEQTRIVYAPQRHRDMIASRYARLGVPIDLREGSRPHGRGTFEVAFARGKGTGSLKVLHAGSDSRVALMQSVSDMRAVQHAKAIYAMLPLDDAATPHLAQALEADGFFFSGLAPMALGDGRDALLLQMPLTHIDASKLVIASDDGKTLLTYIEAQRASALP